MTSAALSVAVTVRDEAQSIAPFLKSLQDQSRPPDEIVVVDGGSTDGTVEQLQAARTADRRLKVFLAPDTTISQGRNLAISQTTGSIIAITDAGTVVDRDWLANLVRPLEDDPGVGVSAGFFLPGGSTFLERLITTVITPQLPEIDPERFLPSSRSVAFRRHWWERVGGYPEWLRHCEDLVFDLDLKRLGAVFAFAPDALVTWHGRRTLGGFARQYFLYARGDGHAHLWAKRHLVRYGAYLSGSVLLAGSRRSTAARLVLLAGAGVHFGKFYRRVWHRRPAQGPGEWARTLALVPVIVVTGDVAKMAGYPLGLFERLQAGTR
jgi:glycosyltransferase involved in cell wall biosynthesis